MPKLGFGRYGDRDITEVPSDYLDWLIRSSEEKVKLYKSELARREAAEDADASWIEKIVKAGYRDLCKKHHPDMGGKTEDMQQINAAFEALRGKK